MFDLMISGKIVKVWGQLAEEGDYIFVLEEDYFNGSEVRYRYWNVYVPEKEWQRRIKLIVEGRRIGVSAYAMEIQWPKEDSRNMATLGIRASRLFIL